MLIYDVKASVKLGLFWIGTATFTQMLFFTCKAQGAKEH